MSQPPDIRPYIELMSVGLRVEISVVGAVKITDIGMAKFLLAYPSAWASLEMMDPQRMADASGGAMTPGVATSIKQLLACALIREFIEPREGRPVPAKDVPGPVFRDAQSLVARALDSRDPDRLATMLALMFDDPVAETRRVVMGFLQVEDR